MRKIMQIIFFVIFCACFVECLKFSSAIHNGTSEDFVIYQRYLETDKQLKRTVSQGIKYVLPYFLEMNEHTNISSKCMNNILTLTSGVRNLKLWALSFLDATGKIPAGLLSRNIQMLGDIDQCLNISVLKKNGQADFQGQYCLLQYSPIAPKPKVQLTLYSYSEEFVNATKNASDALRFLVSLLHQFQLIPAKFGSCMPSGCSKEDIGEIVKFMGEKILLNVSVEYCTVEGSRSLLNTRNIAIISIFLMIGFIGVTASVFEYIESTKEYSIRSTLKNILFCFSITSNFRKVMSTKTTEKSLSCLHGIRVLSMFWIILSHRYLITAAAGVSKYLPLLIGDLIQRFTSQIVINGFFTVDVFFLIGGLLHSYIRIKKETRNGEDSPKHPGFLMVVFFRIWRLAPAYVFTVLIAFLFTSRGPMAPLSERNIKHCGKLWWRHLLFIQNFFDLDEACLGQSWYVSVDMQLFLVSFLSVTLLIRNQKKGLILNAALLMGGIVISTIWCYIGNAPPTVLFYKASKELIKAFEKHFTLPFPHVSAYFTGIFLGFILATKKKIRIASIYRVIGWFLAALGFTSMLFMSVKWNSGAEYTRLEGAMYFTFSRVIYPLAVGWMVFCCAWGYGGIVNYILSMKLWIPLSRISYAMYLLSLEVQVFYTAHLRTLPEFHEMPVIWQYMGDLTITILLSLAVVVLCESPFIALQKLMMQKKTNNKELSTEPTEEYKNGKNTTDPSNSFEEKNNATSKF